MKIFLGSDHTGFELKEELKKFLSEQGHEVEDCGAGSYDPSDNYPDFAGAAAKKVSENDGSMGFVLGGSGQGEQMTANKFKGVRCALFYSPAVPSQAVDITGKTSSDPFEIIRLARQHNDANMLSLGIRFVKKEDAITAVKTFLETPFSQEERHMRRVAKIKEIEKET